ncbi:MAG: DUF885 domain-containing protein [candidate division WOR-3 bacterium]|nr:MAG: DUF885 domain-containing protein [candidate division WOR-3 bacterium]
MSTLLAIIILSGLFSMLDASSSDAAPAVIEELFINFVREYIELSPETGTQLGLSGQYGFDVRNDELDDMSIAGYDKLYQFYRKYRTWLAQYDRQKLTSSQRIASDVLTWYLDDAIRGEQFRYHQYIINPMLSFHNQLTTLLTEHHKIEKLQDAKDYIQRLMQYDKMVSELLEQLLIREQKGIVPPIYIIEIFQQAIDDFIRVPYSENILFTSFVNRIQSLTTIDEESKEKLSQQVLKALENVVYPSYRRMSEYVGSLKGKTDIKAGVWQLPNGADYYSYCLRHHTTTTMTPEEIHTLGLREVKRIQDEITQHLKTLGISGSDKFSDLIAEYRIMTGDVNDIRFYYPFTEEGKLQTLRAYQVIIDTMQSKLTTMFSLIPRTQVRVERLPKFKEATMGTYYQPPKLDGSSDGIFYAQLSYQHFKPGMKALAYHEAIPGHHFQIALERESPDSRLFKALFFFTGYTEGWALYAEKLAKEYGYYDDTHSLIGYLSSELLRAIRLVVDTGIHWKKWTSEEAYYYIVRNYGRTWYSQIVRYIVWPGQACAYKVGELKIVQLREKARQALGERFDIKDFHSVILQHGSVPLEILEQLVDDYIKTARE